MPPRLRRSVGPFPAPVFGPAPGAGGDGAILAERYTTWRGPLPFDYAVSLSLLGKPGNIVQGAITIGPEAAFVATAIGYGFEEDLYRPIDEPAFALPDQKLRPPAADLTFNPRLLTL